MTRENTYIMNELDIIYPQLKSPWKACADELIEQYDSTGLLSWWQADLAESIVNMTKEMRI